jgi:Fe-S-cluster containining protein
MAESARKYHRELDESIARAVSELSVNGKSVSCGKGCAWCCYLPVRATAPEGVLAAHYVRGALPAPGLGDLKGRIEEWLIFRETGYQTGSIFEGPSCPFLSVGLCVIYPVRPMGCRVHSSTADPLFCGPGRPGISLFESPGTVPEIMDLVKPVCMDYRGLLERAGMQFGSIVKPLPELVLGELKSLSCL